MYMLCECSIDSILGFEKEIIEEVSTWMKSIKMKIEKKNNNNNMMKSRPGHVWTVEKTEFMLHQLKEMGL